MKTLYDLFKEMNDGTEIQREVRDDSDRGWLHFLQSGQSSNLIHFREGYVKQIENLLIEI